MTRFDTHTLDSAPAASQPILQQVKKAYGAVPNLFGTFAESPALLQAYLELGGIFDRSTAFDASERQIVLMTTSFENDCEYCMAAHSTVAAGQRVPADVIEALRAGTALADPKLEALRTFTREIIRHRGWVADEDVQGFLDAGYTRRQLLEVILGVGFKTLSNYTNHIATTPVDASFEPRAWSRPTTVSANDA